MLTILVPTYSTRSKLLSRLINYMAACNFKYKILVADSSEPIHLENNSSLIKSVESKLDIKHLQFDKNIINWQKYAIASSQIKTPYMLFNADDDFFIPSSIEKAFQFLALHPEYSIAQGYTVAFELNQNDNYRGIIQAVKFQPTTHFSIEYSFAYERLMKHLQLYQGTFYGVHRTQQLAENLTKVANLKLKLGFRFEELLPSCLSIIQGKLKLLDTLYLFRQSMNQSDQCKREAYRNLPYTFPEWIADPNWSDYYSTFRLCLAEKLSNQENINHNNALSVVKNAIFSYLMTHGVHHKFDNRFSLQSLLQKSSPYHNDFMRIYEATSI